MRKPSLIAISAVAFVLICGVVVTLTGVWPYSAIFPAPDEPKAESDFAREYIDSLADMHRKFPTDADIVFIGDSRIQIPQWPDMFPNASVANRGIGSDTLEGLLKRVDDLGMRNPDVVVLEMGVNDVLMEHPTEVTTSAADQILSHLKATAGRVVVLEIIDCAVEGCDRQKVSALNTNLKMLSDKYGAQFIPVNGRLAGADGLLPVYSHDGLHLNADGYRVLVNILCAQINELACKEGAAAASPETR